MKDASFLYYNMNENNMHRFFFPDNHLINKVKANLLLSILFFLTFLTSALHAENQQILDIQIHLRNAPINPEPILGRVREHIQLSIGAPFNQEKLSETIKLLKQSKMFQDITFDRIVKPDGIIAVFYMTACSVIKNIRISGAFPFFKRDVLNVMTVNTGHVWYPALADKQSERICELFKREGFSDVSARVSARKDPDDGYYIISVKIDTGHCLRLKKMTISGNHFVGTKYLKSMMYTYQVSFIPGNAGCFKENTLRKDIQFLVSWYRKNSFANVSIQSSLERNNQSVNVHLSIDEGPQYVVHFFGNHFFSHRKLNKELHIYKRGNANDIGLRRSKRAILKKYNQNGFLKANLHISGWMNIKEKPFSQHVWFIINEGPRTCINRIEISGNDWLSKKQIKKQMQTDFPSIVGNTPYQPDILNDDIPAIQALYHKHGFLKAEVSKNILWHESKAQVDIQIMINEGPRTIIRSLSFSGDVNFIPQLKLQTLINTPFQSSYIQNDTRYIESQISDKGYPYVTIGKNIKLSKNFKHADITFHIHQGKNVKIGHLYLHGNFKTRRSVIKETLGAKAGDNFSLSNTLKAQQNLRNMQIFNSVKMTPMGLKEKKDTIHLFVEVEEKKPLFLELGSGYKTEKGTFGHLSLGDKNLFGKNKSASVRYEQSEVGYHGTLNIHDPNLLGERIDINFGYYIERLKEFNKSYGTQTYGWTLNMNRNMWQHIRMDTSFRYERRRQFLRDIQSAKKAEQIPKESLRPRSILVASPSIVYDTRNSFIHPKNGLYAAYTMDISKGIANSLDDFIKHYLEVSGYYPINDRLNLACTARFQTINEYGSLKQIPEDQLFYLGGSSDVRGYKENMLLFDDQQLPIGGETILSGSLEARYHLGFNFETFVFGDAGKLSDNTINTNMRTFRLSYGGGIRYHTPIGPIGIMYGFKHRAYENEDRGRLHFSVGYGF